MHLTKIVGVAFVAAGIALTVTAVVIAKRQYKVLKSWPHADATVMKIVPIDTVAGHGKTGRYYGADLTFTFIANARPYLTQTRWQFTSKRELHEQVAAYAAGTRQTIRYNPADPQEVRLNVGYNWNTFDFAIVFGALGPLMLCAGGGVLRFLREEQGGRTAKRARKVQKLGRPR